MTGQRMGIELGTVMKYPCRLVDIPQIKEEAEHDGDHQSPECNSRGLQASSSRHNSRYESSKAGIQHTVHDMSNTHSTLVRAEGVRFLKAERASLREDREGGRERDCFPRSFLLLPRVSSTSILPSTPRVAISACVADDGAAIKCSVLQSKRVKSSDRLDTLHVTLCAARANPPNNHNVQDIKVYSVTLPCRGPLFIASSNDVLDGELRINVLDESTGRIAYYKDRQLVGEEILGGVYVTWLATITRC